MRWIYKQENYTGQRHFLMPPSYPPLDNDIQCDVLIVGAGRSGALCAYYLSETDLDVVVIDKRKAGYGSTMTKLRLAYGMAQSVFIAARPHRSSLSFIR